MKIQACLQIKFSQTKIYGSAPIECENIIEYAKDYLKFKGMSLDHVLVPHSDSCYHVPYSVILDTVEDGGKVSTKASMISLLNVMNIPDTIHRLYELAITHETGIVIQILEY